MTADTKRSTRASGLRRAVLAIGLSELLRPLFARWAADGVRVLYERIEDELWAGNGAPIPNGPELLAAIKAQPESDFDDSHHRDFYVMLALGVLYHAVRVVQDADRSTAESESRELEGLVEHLMDELGVSGATQDIREAASRLSEESDETVVARAVRDAAVGGAAVVDAALDPFARSCGWPVKRVARL
jgi:hypothetical protein